MNTFKIFLILSSLFTSLLSGNASYSQTIKEKKIYPMGRVIHTKLCITLDAKRYESYDELLADIRKKDICTKLSKKHSEALAIYLWDKKNAIKELPKIKVTKQDKCSVCGMYLYHHPNWVARITYAKKEVYSFDGIKDMLKFYFKKKKGIQNIWVQDYYTLKTLDAKNSFYVIGSDVLGPMGNELIAFETLESAKKFSLEHKGKKLLSFDKLTEKIVRSIE